MALLDVSDTLLDLDFVDEMQIVRRKSTVDSMGQNNVAESTFPAVGSIQPTSGKDLDRVPDTLRLSDVRTFFLKSAIRVSAEINAYPDILVFKGQRFQVISVEDWLNYGQGWNSGLCVAEKPS